MPYTLRAPTIASITQAAKTPSIKVFLRDHSQYRLVLLVTQTTDTPSDKALVERQKPSRAAAALEGPN